jgi:hypothetical protein
MLRKYAEEIAERTEKVSSFLCTLIGRTQEKKPVQTPDNVSDNDDERSGSWKDILFTDLKQHGKSYTSDICDRVCVKKGITDSEKKYAMLNTVRTMLGKFRDAGLIKSQEDGNKKIWYIE